MPQARALLQATACLLLGVASLAAGQPTVIATDTLTVITHPLDLGADARAVVPGQDLGRLLAGSPFQLIRRGAATSSDLYADGLKRGDITVTIDGERFTTACPNRMDTRAGQVALQDIELVRLDRTGGSLQAGLGGQLAFRRRMPGHHERIRAAITAAFDHAEEQDMSVAAEARGLRYGLRLRRHLPWTDADGATFAERYGYRDARTAEVLEAQLVKTWGASDAVVTVESASDVLFPYLLMDERENDHYQASLRHRDRRFYVNHNQHMMDNALRTSRQMTDMRTDAVNTMAGVVGPNYEAYVRHWDADNRIVPVANPAMGVDNRMLADIWRYQASVQRELGQRDQLHATVRLGLSRTRMGDTEQADRFDLLDADADHDRWSVPFGATVGRDLAAPGGQRVALSAEVSSNDPEIEQLYINVRRPGANPLWLGNPSLANPVRATVRAEWQHQVVRLEVFGSRVWDYPYVVSRPAGDRMAQTYAGIGALLAGANLTASWEHLDLAATWNWAEQTGNQVPLAEIQPLLLSADLRSPAFGPATARLFYQHAAGQGRVDPGLGERSTGAWDRVDLGLEVATEHATFFLSLENALDELYAQHLSYSRNPFAAGVSVREPGRTVRVGATLDH